MRKTPAGRLLYVASRRADRGTAQGAAELRAYAATFGIGRVELVGLLPAAELARCSDRFRRWADLDESLTIEGRVRG